MDSAKWLASEALSLGGSFVWNFFSSGFFYGFLGLLLGVVLVVLLRRKGHFKRPTTLWRVLVKAQYIFIPLLLASAFSTFGAIRGIQSTINGWIDDSAAEIQAYGESYIPSIKAYAESAASTAGGGEEWLKESILEGAGLEENSMVEKFYVIVNRKIIGYALEQMGLENNSQGLGQLATEGNMQKLSSMSFGGVTGYMKNGFVNAYASGIYWSVAVFFGFLAFLSIGEYLLFRANQKIAPVVKGKIKETRDKLKR